MVNPYLILSPIGMAIVGLSAIFYWKRKSKAAWKYFAFGAVIWAIAIAAKVVMDLTVSQSIYQWLSGFGIVATLAGIGLYVGLRTGFFESGFSYIAVARTRFRKMDAIQAVAFGIGFGGIEAIFLGVTGMINLSLLITNPSLVSMLTPAQQAALDMPTIVVIAPILERIFTLAIHLFCSVLVVYSVIKSRPLFLAYSILFKSLLDGMVPALNYYLNPASFYGAFVAEVPIIALGIIAIYGTRWVLKKF